jgi:hypothetical protein
MHWVPDSNRQGRADEFTSQFEAVAAGIDAHRAGMSDPDFSRREFEKLEARMDDERARKVANGRDDPARRAVQARMGLLRWVYEFHAGVRQHFSNSPYGGLRTGRYRVDRDRFTDDEVRAAAKYLADNGLIKVEYRVRDGVRRRAHEITGAGSECVENHGGNVAGYLDAQKRGETLINIGEINGNTVVGDHANQSNVTHNMGIQPEVLVGFVREILGTLPDLQLDPGRAAGARAALEEVEREAQQAGADSEGARQAFGRFVRGMIDAGPQAVTQLMLMIAQR